MEYINIGQLVTTHGLKGEVKIKSNFKYKDQVFIVNNKIYLGENYQEFTILSYRIHQSYDMVFLEGITSIEEAINYKGFDVYINKDLIKLTNNNYLNEDLIGLDVYYNDLHLGEITRIEDCGLGNEVIEIWGNKRILVPFHENFIESVDLDKKIIHLKNGEGLI